MFTLGAAAELALRVSAGRRGAHTVQRVIGKIGSMPPTVRVRSEHGLLFALDPAAVMDSEMIRTGSYEPEVLKTVLKLLPQNGVFWDIGANIGVHSLTIRYLCPHVTVISFEPAPHPGARLIENARLNGLCLDLWPVALSDSNGYAEMAVNVTTNSGISSLSPWPGSKYDGTTRVRVERADDLIATGLLRPDIVKLDIEGHELAALRGFSSFPKAIVFESTIDSVRKIAQLLSGYSIQPIDSRNYIALRS